MVRRGLDWWGIGFVWVGSFVAAGRDEIVERAIRKQRAGAALSARERKAFAKWTQEQNERRGLLFLAELPKKFWRQWSGRQHKVLNEQAELYGIPIGEATIDVRQVARWLHDFLSAHKHVLPELVREGELEPKTVKGKLEAEKVRQLENRNELLEDQLATNRQTLIPRNEIHDYMIRAAGLLRSAGERLEKRFGQEAAEILIDALDSFEQLTSELDPAHAKPTSDAHRE